MKYTGIIIAFRPKNFANVYNIVDSDSGFLWKAAVVADKVGSGFIMRFNFNGDPYEVKLKSIKEGTYSGEIKWYDENGGKVYFDEFKKGKIILFKGEWDETEFPPYSCFIELSPVEL